MNDFERGFLEELEKISAALGAASTLKPPKPPDIGNLASAGMSTKPLATAMRSPLSMITALKPPDQTFYKGK